MISSSNYPYRKVLTSGTQAISIDYFIENSHVQVEITPVNGSPSYVGTNGTDYSLTGAADENGGTCTMIGKAAGDIVVITREMPFTQDTDLPVRGKFNESDIEQALDELTMNDQQLKGETDRSIRIPRSEAVTSGVTTLPSKAARSSKLAAWDADGNLTVATPGSSAPSDAISITYTATGGVPRTQASKNADVVSVKDLGAVGDGVTDDTVAIQTVLDTGKDVFVPYGTYLISSTLKTTASGQRIFGLGWNSVIKTNDATLQFAIAVITGHIGVQVANLKLLGAGTAAESAPLSSAAIGVNTNAAATAYEMSYPDIQIGRFRCENVWFDNWLTAISNNHSDEGYAVGNLFTRTRGISAGYGYGITSSGSRCTYAFNVFDNNEISGLGSHNGSANASTLTDLTKGWETDVWVGKTLHNLTDGSSGTITANTATTITATLSGGSENDWDVDDEYEVEEAGQGRHAVYLNGHSEGCNVVGNKAYGYARNPFQFKSQLTARSGYNHYIAGNLAKDSNRMENSRGAVYLFDCQTPLTATGKGVTFVDNVADNCRGEQLRFEHHPNSTIRGFKAINAKDHITPANTNHPFIIIYSDYTTIDGYDVDNVAGASRIGMEVQQCSFLKAQNIRVNGSSFRSGLRWSAATPDTTNNCEVRGLIVEGTTSQGDVENAAGTAQGVQTNIHIGSSGQNVGRHIYTIAAGVITVGYGRNVEIAPESGTADDLVTINGGEDHQVISLQIQSGNTVTVKDGTGNLVTNGDFVMNNPADGMTLENRGGSWIELSRSNNI